MTISRAARREAERLGRDGASPHAAFRAAEARYGSGRLPKGSAERREYRDAWKAAFDAAGWEWVIRDWNALGDAAGEVRKRQSPTVPTTEKESP